MADGSREAAILNRDKERRRLIIRVSTGKSGATLITAHSTGTTTHSTWAALASLLELVVLVLGDHTIGQRFVKRSLMGGLKQIGQAAGVDV